MDSEIKYLENIRNYQAVFYESNLSTTVWHKLPLSRRSAVLVLLFLGKYGELRVLLTKRSRSLRNFSGHISFPGGKADTGLETEWETARRESDEEIGLTRDDEQLHKFGLLVEKLTMLPSFLARTLLAVRPCVGVLKASPEETTDQYLVVNNKLLKLTLNPGESSSVFSVPLRDFYDQRKTVGVSKPKELIGKKTIRTNWAGINWNYRSYLFPVRNEQNEVNWLHEIDDLSSEDEALPTIQAKKQPELEKARQEIKHLPGPVRNVWGLTANILYELANIAYSGQDYWKNKQNIGEEEIIYSLNHYGNQLQSGPRTDFEVNIINGNKQTSFFDVLPDSQTDLMKKIYNPKSKM